MPIVNRSMIKGGAISYWCSFSSLSSMDTVIVDEAVQRGMRIDEVDGARTTVANLEGVIFEITLKWCISIGNAVVK